MNLLPTPAKSHYTFNLRDFARVVQGCLLMKKQSLENKHTMIRLFVHEVFRVFYDRLVDDKDRAWLFQLMHTIVKNTFDESFEKVFEHLKQGSKVSRHLVASAFSSAQLCLCSVNIKDIHLKEKDKYLFCFVSLMFSWLRKTCAIFCLVTT